MKIALFITFVLSASPLAAAEIVATGNVWKVQPDFEKNEEARTELSGAVCVTGTKHCLIVNDEKKYAQFFDIGSDQLQPGRVIKLLADKVDGVEMKEIDAEAVAFAGDHYFVTGSHGLSRQSGSFKPSMFNVFRFKVDKGNGLPPFDFDDDDPVPEIESRPWLRDIIKEQPEIEPFAEKKLDQNGANIEAMVASGPDLIFGFRAPVIGENKDHAIVLRVDAEAFFGATKPAGWVKELTLEPGLGIRDMAVVKNGILLLAGPSADVAGKSSLWLWDGAGSYPTKLGDFPDIAPSEKAETLLVTADDENDLRLLVLFDGISNGGPREFVVKP